MGVLHLCLYLFLILLIGLHVLLSLITIINNSPPYRLRPYILTPWSSLCICTVPYPGVDKVKVKVNVGVKVSLRRRLGEETPSASIAEAGRRREEASPR